MPTIEIACLGQTKPTKFLDLPFAVESENKLISHRGLLNADFESLDGCIYHLGNPGLRSSRDFVFFAFELVDDAVTASGGKYLRFDDEFAPYVKKMMGELMSSSPLSQLTFSSDWQFGPDKAVRFDPISTEGFWTMHNSNKLRFNAFYKIQAD